MNDKKNYTFQNVMYQTRRSANELHKIVLWQRNTGRTSKMDMCQVVLQCKLLVIQILKKEEKGLN